MATVKSYTDIEQSKKLMTILPLDSSDGGWYGTNNPFAANTTFWLHTEYSNKAAFPAWSLAALLNVLPSATLDSSDNHHYRVYCNGRFTDWYDNSIDACYRMVLKLHEQELL